MRKIGYEVEGTAITVWTLAEKKNLEKNGVKLITRLIDIPEKRYKDDLIPWVEENGKLVRQTA